MTPTSSTTRPPRLVPRASRTSSLTGCLAGSCPRTGALVDNMPKTSVGNFDEEQQRMLHVNGELRVERLGSRTSTATSH